MKSEFIDGLEISEVYDETLCSETDLYFTLQGQQFYIFFREKQGALRPISVVHSPKKKGECCVLCGKNDRSFRSCGVLSPHLIPLYHRLVEHPSVRLHWLYLNHDEPLRYESWERTNMTRKFVKNMDITDVSQHKESDDSVVIEFFIDDFPYYLDVKRNISGDFFPFALRHHSDERCDFCEERYKKWSECRNLDRRREGMFYRLIQFPSIRLEWVFLPYKEKPKKGAKK